MDSVMKELMGQCPLSPQNFWARTAPGSPRSPVTLLQCVGEFITSLLHTLGCRMVFKKFVSTVRQTDIQTHIHVMKRVSLSLSLFYSCRLRTFLPVA